MILTAKDMHNSPAQAYREADKGETVVINHDRYPDKVFELTARERKPLLNLRNPQKVMNTLSTDLGESINKTAEIMAPAAKDIWPTPVVKIDLEEKK